MGRDKAPAFQFYVKDWLADERVRLMSHTEKGIYMDLICCCWNEGSLPLETDALARLVGVALVRFTKLWERSPLRQCFFLGDDGRLHHKRLEEERIKQATFRRRQSDNGKLGGRPKQAEKPHGEKPRPFENESQLCVNDETGGFPKKSSAICNLHSPERDRARDESDRAANLCARYPRIYADCRSGAQYAVREARDFPAFEAIVEREPNDDRVDKLLKLFLLLPRSRDVLNVPGTPRQFLHMLPECDRMLREKGL